MREATELDSVITERRLRLEWTLKLCSFTSITTRYKTRSLLSF